MLKMRDNINTISIYHVTLLVHYFVVTKERILNSRLQAHLENRGMVDSPIVSMVSGQTGQPWMLYGEGVGG